MILVKLEPVAWRICILSMRHGPFRLLEFGAFLFKFMWAFFLLSIANRVGKGSAVVSVMDMSDARRS